MDWAIWVPTKSCHCITITPGQETEHVKVVHGAFEQEAKVHRMPPFLSPRSHLSIVTGIPADNMLEAAQALIVPDSNKLLLVRFVAVVLDDGAR